MLLPILGTTLTLIAALWLLRIAAPRAATRASSSTQALGTGLALALPFIAAASRWQWLGSPPETRLALITIAALPVAATLLAISAALLSKNHHRASPPLRLPIAALIIAAALCIIADAESVRLIDAQALGLFAIVGWWWATIRRNDNHPSETAEPTPSTTPPPGPRAKFLAPLTLATISAYFSAPDWRIAAIALIVWTAAGAWFLRPLIARSNWAPAVGLAAGAPALGLGWLAIVESLRLINAVHQEAIAMGIQLGWIDRLFFAAEALGTRPVLPDTALLAAPAAAIAALALFLLLIRQPQSDHPTPTPPTPWRAGAVAGMWLIVALAIILAPAALVLR